jgi:hypothetical protein
MSQLTKITDVHAADKISSVTDEGAPWGVESDLPEILRLIEGVPCRRGTELWRRWGCLIMVLYDRRMRLAAEEVDPIMEMVRLRLRELVEARGDLEAAELLFRPLWRFHYPYWGRPGYPEPVAWADIEALLKEWTIIRAGEVF